MKNWPNVLCNEKILPSTANVNSTPILSALGALPITLRSKDYSVAHVELAKFYFPPMAVWRTTSWGIVDIAITGIHYEYHK